MTLLHTQGRSSGERHAIKAWLEEHGAGSGPQIDTAKLEGTGINGAALTHAAEKGPIDLLVLKGATQEGQRPDLDEKQRVAGAKLALKNATKLSVSVTDQLLSLTGKGIPSKDALSKLSAKSKALYQETFRWSQGDKYLAWLKPEEHQVILAQGQALESAYLNFAGELAEAVAKSGKAPGPFAARALEQIRSDLLNAGSWSRMLIPDETKIAEKQARTLDKLQATLGLSAAAVKERFHFTLDGHGEPVLRTTQPLDIDLSGRGLSGVVGGRSWALHQGDLNFADNMMTSAWVLPDRVEGSVSLANNALRELRTFTYHTVEITKDLDLSHNKNLRSLDGLEEIKIGGDLNLVGVPATSLPSKLQIGGKLILDASQADLIRSAEYRKLPYVVVDKPGFVPFQVPADPAAAILDATRCAAWSGDELRAVVRAIPGEEHEVVAKVLLPRIAGSGLEARQAFRAVEILDFKLSQERLAAELALIPTAPEAPMPEALLALPLWKLHALCRVAYGADLKAQIEHPSEKTGFPLASTAETPRADRVLEALVEQARAGVPVGFRGLPRLGWDHGDVGHLARDRGAPQTWEILALDLNSVRLEKGELYLKLKSEPAEIPAAEVFRGFAGNENSYAAMESVLARYPKNEALLSTYRFLLENTFSDYGVAHSEEQHHRRALVGEQILALAKPRPALASIMTKLEGLSRHTTVSGAAAVAAAVTEGAKHLSEHERGAVFQALLRQDNAELSRGEHPRARSHILNAAGQLFLSFKPEERRIFLEPLVFATVDQLFNQPTEAKQAQGRFDVSLGAVPPSLRAYLLDAFKGPLGACAPGKEVLDGGVKRLIDALPDIQVAKALRYSGWWYGLSPYRAEVQAKVATLKLEGELAVQLRPILEHLKLLPGMKGQAE
ncbi:MAG: hypothetical protein U1E65_36255 [Myxococcota bacterium]